MLRMLDTAPLLKQAWLSNCHELLSERTRAFILWALKSCEENVSQFRRGKIREDSWWGFHVHNNKLPKPFGWNLGALVEWGVVLWLHVFTHVGAPHGSKNILKITNRLYRQRRVLVQSRIWSIHESGRLVRELTGCFMNRLVDS